ncbi:hypothetical protein CC80DRAFT_491158 [Byssothecium circinans]|uniref:Uncharacterized protein n=1 Tax=Byssothecium circinans TaxID=147558 RepID=A0A6A5TZC8_9PLEO|nr:hypothetical protein CC80DRAFT_491158 [Byssothecium circinans]
MTNSSISSPDEDFGSNGQPPASQRPIVKGYCAGDGPFKDIEIQYLDRKYYLHCLS